MRYNVLFIDADDTLLDFQKCEFCAIENTFKKYDLIFNEEVFSIYKKHNHTLWSAFERGEITKPEILNRRFRETFAELGYLDVPTSFEEEYQLALGDGGYIIEGVDEVLHKLSEHCAIYVLTNGVSTTQHSRLKKSGLLPYIKGVFISEELGSQKPQKEYFDAVLKVLEIEDKSSILMIGDSLGSDIQGGINAGIDTCWYNPQNKHSDLPLYEIHSMNELVDLVLLEEDVSNELWDLYDKDRMLLPQTMLRGEMVPEGCYHLICESWVISGDKVLVTRRHPNKTQGGKFECTGGSALHGENTSQAMVRELKEEIGLTVSEDELILIYTNVGKNYIWDTFVVKKSINLDELNLLKNEVISAHLFDYSEVKELMEQGKFVSILKNRFEAYKDEWEKIYSLK